VDVTNEELPEEMYMDLVLLNGKIVTVDSKDTVAQAVAVKGDTIVKVATTREVEKMVGKHTKVIDLNGKVVLPGFIDTHDHTIGRGARSGAHLDLHDATSMEDMIRKIREVAKKTPEGVWIFGSGFDEASWPEKRFPTRWDIDKATTEHPVYLSPPGGHCWAVNSKVLEMAGITKDTLSPVGGELVKDPETGEPTGRLNELASRLVRHVMPALTPAERQSKMVENWPEIENELLSWGVTTICEAHIKAPQVTAYLELLRQGKLNIRVGLMLDGMAPYEGYATDDLARQGLQTGFGWSDKLRIHGVKLGVDGSLGTRTAYLNEPYWGEPDNVGISRVTQAELTDEVTRCHLAGLRVNIHAIGDKAIDMCLEAIEEALKKKPVKDHRHTIEHCGVCGPEQLERMRRLGVLASASIGFCYLVGNRHTVALGPGSERLCRYYPMRSFQEYGIVAGANSDSIGPNWPLAHIYGMVTRKAKNGEELCPAQAISVMDAIRVSTYNGAYLEGLEDKKGSIEPGKLADMVIINKDILTCDPDELKDFKVLTTIVGGEIVYQRE